MRSLRAGFLVAVAVAVAGCTTAVTVDAPDIVKMEPEVVVKGDIATYITFDVSVTEDAHYVVRSPSEGSISLKVDAGDSVAAGQVLAVIGAKTLVKSPGAGTVIAVTADRKASLNTAVVTMRAAGMALVGTAPAATLLRLAERSEERARAQIASGQGPFECVLAGGPELKDSMVYQTCLPLTKPTLYPGLTGVMAVASGTRKGVLTLPLAAVAGSAESGLVRRIGADSREELVPVKLGISDGLRVEIVAGLNEGDTVAMPAPNLPGMS